MIHVTHYFQGIEEVSPSIWRWIYMATVVAPIAGPTLTYGMILLGIFLLSIVFIHAYKNIIIGKKPIEIVELGRETIRRSSTLIIDCSHKLLPHRDTAYQPLDSNLANSLEDDPEFEEVHHLKRLELSQSLDEFKRIKKEFVKSHFNLNEAERESLIDSDNSFIQSELRRCNVLNLYED